MKKNKKSKYPIYCSFLVFCGGLAGMQLAKEHHPEHRQGLALDKNGKALRGKSAPQYINNGLIINKFKFIKMIGGGGFGQIYKVINIDDTNQIAAAKIEPQGSEQGRMILELQVLLELRNVHHIPTLYASGEFEHFNFIVMELLGRNLTEIRKRMRTKRMSVVSTFKIGIQISEAFHSLHSFGYIHRDIKPSNMCMGYGAKSNTVYLVDFGMARKFITKGGRIRKERQYAAFRGTLRYVSIRVHERREQSPADDFISLYYTMMELVEGSLPWRLMTEHDQILAEKIRHSFDSLAVFCPLAMREFVDHVNNLYYDEMPNYELIDRVFRSCMPNGLSSTDDFDFDENSSNLL